MRMAESGYMLLQISQVFESCAANMQNRSSCQLWGLPTKSCSVQYVCWITVYKMFLNHHQTVFHASY